MNIKKIIDGLYFTVGMMLFNPATGVSKTPDELNEDDRYTYDACMGAIELLKAQEPVEPKIIDTSNSKLYHNDMFKNHYCGNCGEFLHVVNRKDMFCYQCGKAVKWDD